MLNAVTDFFLKLDWSHPSTYAAILGSLGAPKVFIGTGRYIRLQWNTRFMRYRRRGVQSDFYYVKRDHGYRIMDDGTTYVNVRTEEIVSLSKKLARIPLTYLWSGKGQIRVEIRPSTLTVVDAPKITGKVQTRKHIVFETPLRKGKKAEYTVILSCDAGERQPEPFLSSASARRVDMLILRVVFPSSKRPTRAVYRALDPDGNEKARQVLECFDDLTGEYRKTIRYPKPFFEHRIEWE